MRPVLTEISVGGRAVRRVAPARPRDVFAGQPLVMAVELDPRGGTLEVQGRLAAEGSATAWVRALEVPAGGAVGASAGVSASPLPIGALYGREAIADVEAELRGRDHEARLRAIEQLGLRHRITSRCTSLVAIAEEPSVDPTAPRRRERLAVELPMGVSAAGAGLVGGMHLMAAMPRARGLHLIGSLAPDILVRLAGQGMDRALMRVFPQPVAIGRVTVIKMEKRILELEFEAPVDEFAVPRGEMTVLVAGREVGKASVIPGRSTREGSVGKGLLVKLALELRRGKKWEDWREVELSWIEEPEVPGGGAWPLSWELKVVLAPVGGKGRR